jgi:sulfatase maturation enzyme AslB (radical SAM superfamily)
VRTLHLVLTSACNLSCSYCYQDRRAASVIEWDVVRRSLGWLFRPRERDLHLNIYGGEPLLAFPLLRRVVEHARSATPPGRRLRVDTTTNALLLDRATVDFLAAHGVHTQVSFDGVPRAQDLRRPGTFRLLDERLRRIQREQPAFFEDFLDVAATVTAANLPALGDSVDYFLDLGVRTVRLTPRLTWDPDWRLGRARQMGRQLARICRASRRHLRRTGRVPVALFRRQRGDAERRAVPARMCGVGSRRSLVVDVDGSVHGCVLFARSYQSLGSPGLRRWIGPLAVGRLDDPGLDRRLRAFTARVHRSPLFARRDRKRSGYGRCADCRELAHCTVCPVSIAHFPGGGDPHRIPDLPCAFVRAVWRHVRHFPDQPGDVDRLTGGRPRPELVSELLASAPVQRAASWMMPVEDRA